MIKDDAREILEKYRQEFDYGSNESSTDTEGSVDSGQPSRPFCEWLERRRGRTGGEEGGKARALVIDGGTLPFVLSPDLKPLFLDVASRCVSVICSRATPIQKVSHCVRVHIHYGCVCVYHMYMYMYMYVCV